MAELRTDMLPNFFIVGAPKAGTTSLYHYLSEHPEVFMSEPKELNYFSSREIDRQHLYYKTTVVRDLDEYQKYFSNSRNKKAIGEVSVSYLFYKEVPTRIYDLIPDAKIIIILRDPVVRGFSHYLMDKRLGYIDCSFEDVVFKRVESKYSNLYYQQYVELGFYYEQVKRYVDVFGSNRVKLFFFNELKENPRQLTSGLFEFLEIDNTFIPDLSEQYNVSFSPKNYIIKKLYSSKSLRRVLKKFISKHQKSNLLKKFLSGNDVKEPGDEVKEYLKTLYRSDMLKLEKLIKQDLPFL